MKKALLIILGLTTIGGIAYWMSTSGLLQGSMIMQVATENKTINEVQSLNADVLDPDGDGLTTGQEADFGSDPELKDTDGGGIPDGVEHKKEMDPNDPSDDAELLAGESATGTTNTQKTEISAANSNTQQTNTYTCSALTIDPATLTVASEEEAAAGVDFTVDIALAGNVDIGQVGTWKGTLIIRTSGKGSFTDSKGKTGTSLSIPATESKTSFDLTYAGGASGDLISAYIENEQGCSDTLTIELAQSATGQTQTPGVTTKNTLLCTDLDITPDTYTLTTGETSMSFNVIVKGSMQISWENFAKNLMAFSGVPGKTTTSSEVLGNLIIETDGTGSLSNDKNAKTGTSINVVISGTATNVKVTYKTPVGGETMKAYIKDQENLCSDSLTLTAAPVAVAAPAATTTTSTTTTTTEPVTTTTTTVAATDDGSLVEGAEKIIGGEEYVCPGTPFTDIPDDAWYKDTACRVYYAGMFTGTSATKDSPGGYFTRAQAAKVIDVLAGYTTADAAGKTEDFLDVTEGDWYHPWIAIAQPDVIRTIDAGLYYGPNDPISKGWFLLYATRAAGKTLAYGTEWTEADMLCDDMSVSDPYTYAFILANKTLVTTPEEGEIAIANCDSDGKANLGDYLSRADAMALAQRLYLSDWYSN